MRVRSLVAAVPLAAAPNLPANAPPGTSGYAGQESRDIKSLPAPGHMMPGHDPHRKH